MAKIHPTAIVDARAIIHETAEIGPFSHIDADVTVGDGTVIEGNVRIFSGTTLGSFNHVYQNTILGAPPQDQQFDQDTITELQIGDHNCLREYVSVHRSTNPGKPTTIGDNNYLMAYSHVAHDCQLGDRNIFANGATLGGHVEVDHHTFLSGHVVIHQFCRIGAYAMISGVSSATQDVPPYTMADGHRAEVIGLNLVGLKRAGFSQDQRTTIKRAYKILYRSGLSRKTALNKLRSGDFPTEVEQIVKFVEQSQRGILHHRRALVRE